MNIQSVLQDLSKGASLTRAQMQEVMHACLLGKLSEVQLAAFLALMHMKGETALELSTAADVMRSYAETIKLGDDVIDIVGTGGDGSNTFNISTVSSFVAAGAGVRVAKHGNRSASSRSGSSDVLLEAGFNLELSQEALTQCLEECNIVFLFAPHFQKALKHVHSVRQQLGMRTLFNILGPLLNPALVKRQVVGVSRKDLLSPVAEVLIHLGSQHCLVVHAEDGLDEISISAKTDILEYHHGHRSSWMLDPKDYDCYHPTLEGIIIQNPTQSLAICQEVLSGKQGPARDIVLLNAAAAIYCAKSYKDFSMALLEAKTAIDSGKAEECFHHLLQLSQSLGTSKHA